MDIQVQHINAAKEDLAGNHGIGRYLLLTGSDERAREISDYFSDVKILTHPRQHNLYIGKLAVEDQWIDVGAISTGIGGPSADIIVNELIILGARRFLRIGTAGSMQPETIRVGELVVATAAVRDDKASWDYIYPEYPAISALEYLIAARRAQLLMPESIKIHSGIVHSKSSLYAREYHFSFMADNDQYMESLQQAGVLVSEMECAQLFTLSSLMSARLSQQTKQTISIFAGAILAVVGDKTCFSDDKNLVKRAVSQAITYGLECTKQLYLIDRETN